MKIQRIVAACGVLMVLTAVSAHAHRRSFTFTYDWFTPALKEKELEL
jgi:hypothetical protein